MDSNSDVKKEIQKMNALNHYYAQEDEDYYYNMHKYLSEYVDIKDSVCHLTPQQKMEFYLTWLEVYKEVRDNWNATTN